VHRAQDSQLGGMSSSPKEIPGGFEVEQELF